MATRLTSAGVVFTNGTSQSTNAVEFPSGTSMIFYQSSSPIGWTKSAVHNNKAFRVVSGVGGGSEGSTSFTSVLTSRTVSGGVGGTTLATSQIPSHYHHTLHVQDTSSWGYGGGYSGKFISTNYDPVDWAYTSSRGGTGSHDHSFSGGSLDFSVNYIDMIIATKN